MRFRQQFKINISCTGFAEFCKLVSGTDKIKWEFTGKVPEIKFGAGSQSLCFPREMVSWEFLLLERMVRKH